MKMDCTDEKFMLCTTINYIGFNNFNIHVLNIPIKKSVIRNPQSVILYLSASFKD